MHDTDDERAEPDTGPERVGHRYAARRRQRLVRPGLDLTVTRGLPGFVGGESVEAPHLVEESVTILSEYRQQVKAYRKAAGAERRLSGRQWKRHRRVLKREGLL